MAVDPRDPPAAFDPAAFETFRFTARSLDERGRIALRYALDDEVRFVERFALPAGTSIDAATRERVAGLLALLHWVAGVSYFKAAAPPRVGFDGAAPPPAAALLLEALYSEGLGEFAVVNGLAALPRPAFAAGRRRPPAGAARPADAAHGRRPLRRVLVPVGGGKDSIVAIEALRDAGPELALLSVGDAPPIARTATVAGLPRIVVTRTLDPGLAALNRDGALNGHVPVTAIIACVALLTAAVRGFDAVALANERSASHGNLRWDGIEVNHQFSKSLRAERLLRDAVAELAPGGPQLFSLLRPASELAIARAFARLERYHDAFTSCNAVFRLDARRRAASWCGDCPKCRFVFLVLAPFSPPARLGALFGADLLDDERQFDGFALLTASGGSKPFECVGEEQESLAAIRLLAADERWRGRPVVRRLVAEVLPRFAADEGDPATVLALADDHCVPAELLPHVRALLGA